VHLGHDILHGVFHFEGKMWRTLPELFFHPGRLTRRYIDGERAKFVSPMALYLFTVFLMFAVFSFTASSMFDSAEDSVAGDVIEAMEGEQRGCAGAHQGQGGRRARATQGGRSDAAKACRARKEAE
jgi:hypothetical protein